MKNFLKSNIITMIYLIFEIIIIGNNILNEIYSNLNTGYISQSNSQGYIGAGIADTIIFTFLILFSVLLFLIISIIRVIRKKNIYLSFFIISIITILFPFITGLIFDKLS